MQYQYANRSYVYALLMTACSWARAAHTESCRLRRAPTSSAVFSSMRPMLCAISVAKL
jgi:hypothetical protein